ncbi:hypothetical protein ACFQ1L_20435 [Phytohabitans flavus]|nr:hypothetical protein [Phytohabitans flavus]
MAERFVPSRDGFGFDNSWPSQPAVVLPTPFGDLRLGDAKAGLCGGMAFAALDHWRVGVPPPTQRPAQGERLYKFIVERLIDSWHLPTGVVQYYQWMNLPDGDTAFRVFGRRVLTEHGLAWRTIRTQWPQVRADLKRGMPVPLGVVTVASRDPRDLAANHQVLAFDHTAEGSRVTLRVYDPNRGRRDDIFIAFDTAAPGRPTTFAHNLGLGRRRVRGFFRAAYSPATLPVP